MKTYHQGKPVQTFNETIPPKNLFSIILHCIMSKTHDLFKTTKNKNGLTKSSLYLKQSLNTNPILAQPW